MRTAEHLAHDHLDVLVVDLDPLQTVDLLDLIDQVLGDFLFPNNGQDIMRVRRAIHERLAGSHVVTLVDADMLAFGDQVFLGSPTSGVTMTLRLPLVSLPNPTTLDLGDDRILLGLRTSNSSATRGRPR